MQGKQPDGGPIEVSIAGASPGRDSRWRFRSGRKLQGVLGQQPHSGSVMIVPSRATCHLLIDLDARLDLHFCSVACCFCPFNLGRSGQGGIANGRLWRSIVSEKRARNQRSEPWTRSVVCSCVVGKKYVCFDVTDVHSD